MTYLYTFQRVPSDGGQPNGPLFQANDGNFYGTTRAGGANDCGGFEYFCGTVYRVTPGGTETVLYSFGASSTDAYRPSGQLIQASDGALYGLSASGGAHGAGTVYRITLSGAYSILYSFGAAPSDGAAPVGGLTVGSDGDLYGATASGGTNHCGNIPQSGGNCGTIFKISLGGTMQTLYSFGISASDGITPNGSLLQASDGNFYGTTVNGGANGCGSGANNCGTVFRMTPAGVLTVLHSFGASRASGAAPQGPLIQGRDGAFYGTTVAGGSDSSFCGNSAGCGSVFRMTATGTVTTLYSFASPSDGYGPTPFLIQGRDGNFYGTTGSGGATPGDLNGTIFRLTPSGTKTILFSFGPLQTNPSNPVGGLIEASDGAFYGVTNYSGPGGSGSGNVFKLMLQ